MKDVTGALPPAIAAYLDAHDPPDREAFAAAFVPDALVNDRRREFLGRDAILDWAEKEIFGDRVTAKVRRAFEHHGCHLVHVVYDGDFDKTNLPDPLVLTNYVHLEDGRIAQLLVIRNDTIVEGAAGEDRG